MGRAQEISSQKAKKQVRSQVLGVKAKVQLQLIRFVTRVRLVSKSHDPDPHFWCARTQTHTQSHTVVCVELGRDSLVTSCSGCSSKRCNWLCLPCMSHFVLHLFLCPNSILHWHKILIYKDPHTNKHTHACTHKHTMRHMCTSKHLHMLT